MQKGIRGGGALSFNSEMSLPPVPNPWHICMCHLCQLGHTGKSHGETLFLFAVLLFWWAVLFGFSVIIVVDSFVIPQPQQSQLSSVNDTFNV